MKKIINFIKNPILAIVILIVDIALILFDQLLVEYPLNGIFSGSFNSPTAIAINNNNDFALIDNYQTIYFMDSDLNTEHLIYGDGYFQYFQPIFDDDNNLYVYYLEFDDNDSLISIGIKEFDSNGKFINDLINLTDEYINSDIYGLNYSDGLIHYIICDPYGHSDLIDYSVSEGIINTISINDRTDGCYINNASYNDGYYAVIYSDSSCGLVDALTGEYTEWYQSDFDAYYNPDGGIPSFVVPFYGGIAGLFGRNDSLSVSFLSEPYSELEDFIYSLDYYPYESLEDNDYLSLYISSINSNNGDLYFSIYDEMYILVDQDYFISISSTESYPFLIILINIIHSISFVTVTILSILAFVLIFGNLIKWRLTMLWKQIFITVPIVILMFVFILFNFVKAYDNLYFSNIADELMSINEISLGYFDGDLLEQCSNYESVENGTVSYFSSLLSSLINNNLTSWNNDLSMNLYYKTGAGYEGLLIASSNSSSKAFSSQVNYLDYDTLKGYYDSGNYSGFLKVYDSTVVTQTGIYDTDNISSITSIYNSNGYEVGFLISRLNFNSYLEEKNIMISNMVLKAVVFLVIFIFAISIFTYLNTRRLKKAEKAITSIASGNFDIRINNSGKDEVGEICNGVNEMAKQLEHHFEELDRNEKFYYKFVPEKFRELLGKESFTDLCLGDAQSIDLTVLFCDIRSFSLNSEMMTAKENFEFVNIIYGKAGPIIRKHNGFVDKYIGDAVMALFEKADDAVMAGIELYKEVVLNSHTAEQLGVSSINIGVGIHSGMARIGIVGESERLSGTVISDTVNVSSRLESLTKQYNTAMIISKDTLDRLSDPDSLKVRYLGMIQVAGVNEVKALYEVLECLDDSRRTPRERFALDFREAVKSFHLGQFNESIEMFKKITNSFVSNSQELSEENKTDVVLTDKDINILDPVPEMYIEYIENKIEKNDYEHNVFKFNKK